jgi:X-Pro dipeptidyl-peptidase
MRPRSALLLALAVLLLVAPPAAAELPEFRNLSQPVYTEAVTEELTVETEFGTIYGWVRRPVTPEGVKVPVILTYSPYAAVGSQAPGTDGMVSFYVPRGYARAFFHLVGTGWSGGCTDYGGLRERRTAAAVVDFLGSREWSNGRVGMIGGSYDGTTQWAAAIEQPEHLATIVPQVAISRWYDYAYGQGVRFLSGYLTPLAFDYGFNQAPVVADPAKTPLGEKLVDDVHPCDNVEHQLRGYGPDPVHDGWWGERDYRARAANVDVPVLLEGSWTDYNVHPINSEAMWQEIAGDERHRLVMGLQGHGVPGFINSARLHHAWFDRHLQGRDTGVEAVPVVQSQLSGGAAPQDSPRWPPPGTETVRLDLGEELTGPADRWTDSNPQLDQSDVLGGRAAGAGIVFVGEPSERDVRLAGTPRLRLRLTTDRISTHVTPVLFTQAPNGSRTWFTRGLLNSRNREGIDSSKPLAPGTPWEGDVVFQPADHLLAEGHRLGVALMSMNRSEALYGDDTFATNVVHLGGASSLELGVAPAPEEG